MRDLKRSYPAVSQNYNFIDYSSVYTVLVRKSMPIVEAQWGSNQSKMNLYRMEDFPTL